MNTVTLPAGARLRWRSSMSLWVSAAALSLVLVVAGWSAGVLVAWLLAVVWAAAVDARMSRLPDRIVIVGSAVFVGVLLLAAPSLGWGPVARAALGAGVLGVPFGVMHLVSPAGFGFGDVKFGVLLGLGLGVLRPGLGLLVFGSAAVVQLVVVWLRPWPAQRVAGADRRSAPFGPALAIAAVGWVAVVLISGGGV